MVEAFFMKKVRGAKRLPTGGFVDKPYCPICNKTVPSLMKHMQNVHGSPVY